MLEKLTEIETLLKAIGYIVPAIMGVVGAAAYFAFFRKKERRLFKNMQRPVAVLGSTADPMAHEASLIEKVDLFKVDPFPGGNRDIDLIDDHYRLVVIRYQKGSKQFWSNFDKLAARRMPMVVFARPKEIPPADIDRIQAYSLHTLCNSPLRLVSDVFAIMGSYPESKS